MSAPDSSSVAAWVTRDTSSWASSTTTTSYSGSIGMPSTASMASSEWLVTTSWERIARSLARSAKHSVPKGHLAAPRHSRWETLTWRQTRSVWRGAWSRSPVPLPSACSSTHSRSATTSAPSGALGQLDERALVVGDALAHAVQAGVVRPPLEHGEPAVVLDQRTGGLHQRREVALDQLVLQRQGRGRDDHPLAVQQRRDEVAQRLAGAGAGLDEQVVTVVHRRARPPRPSRSGRAAPRRRAPGHRGPARPRRAPHGPAPAARPPEHPMCRAAAPWRGRGTARPVRRRG